MNCNFDLNLNNRISRIKILHECCFFWSYGDVSLSIILGITFGISKEKSEKY